MPGSFALGAALLGLCFDDLLAPIVPARADVVTQMHLAGGRLDCERWVCERIMRTVHAALGGRFLVLLNCHKDSFELVPSISAGTRFVLRRHRQSQNDLVLDELPDVHTP